MSRDFFLQQSSHGEAVQRPTLAGLAAGPSYSCAAHCFRGLQNTAILHQERREAQGERVSPVPRPRCRCRHRRSAVTLRAARQAAPGCPASPGRESATTNLSSDDLAPTLRTCPRLAGSESGKRTAGLPPLPRGVARRESGRGTLRLPLASFLLGRVFNWGAATARPRPSPRPHAGRAPRGRARGWCPSPRRPGAGLRPAPPSHPPTRPTAPQSRGFGGSRWRSHPAGTDRGGRRLRGPCGPSACLLCLYTPREAAGGRGGRRAGEERARASERARGGRGGAGRAGGLGGAEPSLHCV